jgi:lipopolysaccharide export system permease protein
MLGIFNTLERYIFGRLLAAGLLVLLGLNGILWIIWATRGDVFFAAGAEAAAKFLGLTFLTLPLISASLLPFALLIGGLQAFASLNRDNELVIIDAAGVGRKRIWRPVLSLGFLTMLAAGTLSIQLGPASMRTFEQMTQNVGAEIVFSIFQKGEFKELTDGLTVHIGSLEGGETLGEVFISDERDPEIHFVYYARQGSVVRREGGAYLALVDGQIHRLPRGEAKPSVVNFDSYAFDFSSLIASQQAGTVGLEARNVGELIDPDLNDPLFRDRADDVKRELLDRFSGPLWAMAFAAAVLFFGAHATTGRGGAGASGSLAFLICGAARALGWGILGFSATTPGMF